MLVSTVLHRTPTPALGHLAALRYRSPGLYGPSRSYRRFVILGHQRTGSTLVSSSLRKHSRVWCFSEVFNARSIQLYTPGLSNDSMLLKAYRERDPVAFLDRFIFRGYRSDILAVGFKLFPEHTRLPHMDRLVDGLAGDGELRLIHVYRANHLRVLLSLKLAQQTANWSTHDGGHPAEARVAIEPDELIAFSRQRSTEEAMLRDRFHGTRLHEVEYESLACDLPTTLLELQRFLGIDPLPIEPVLQKQTTGSLAARIVNHDLLRAHFTGTEYAGWFED